MVSREGRRRAAGGRSPGLHGRGVTYVWTLIAIALLGAGLAAAARVWDTAARREREAELLFAGRAFRNAIAAYHDATPGAVKVFPRALEDLLEDRRYPQTRRHLRRIYVDPMTRRADWGLVRAPDGGIAGVHSRSDAAPLKSGGFSGPDAEFEGKPRYSEWRFVHAAGIGATTSGTTSAPAASPTSALTRPQPVAPLVPASPVQAPAPLAGPAPNVKVFPPAQAPRREPASDASACDQDRQVFLAQCLARVKGRAPALEKACESAAASRHSTCLRLTPG